MINRLSTVSKTLVRGVEVDGWRKGDDNTKVNLVDVGLDALFSRVVVGEGTGEEGEDRREADQGDQRKRCREEDEEDDRG